MTAARSGTPAPGPPPEPFADLDLVETDRWRVFDLVDPGRDTDPPPPAPWAAVTARVVDPAGVVRLGLSHAVVAYDGRRREVRIERGSATLARRRWRPAVGDRVAAVVTGRRVTALVRPAGPARRPADRWRPLLTAGEPPRSALDLTAAEVWARQEWVVDGAVDGAVDDVRHGPFGAAGLRDPHLVVHADGTPYERDGRRWLTWTCAGLGGFAEAHWGVFSVDPAEPRSLRLEAHLWTRRDGRLLGDHAGQLVREGDTWRVATSSWGDFDGTAATGVHVRTAVTRADLLSGLHLLDTEPVTLPHEMAWDPALQRDDQDRGWLVGYTAGRSLSPFRFRPALARTDGPDPWAGLRPLGVADGTDQAEGTLLVRRHGRTWLLASDAERSRYPVFDTVLMAPAGVLRAAYPSNIPHPQLLTTGSGEHGADWFALTFDGTPWEPRRRRTGRRPVLGYGTHGDVVVLSSRPDGRRSSRRSRPG